MEFFLKIADKIPVSILLLLSASSVISGDYFAKSWSINRKGLFLALALIFYFGSGLFYIPTLLKEGLVITAVIWYLLSFVGFLIIGLVIFHETLNLLQIIGIILGLTSLIILVSTR